MNMPGGRGASPSAAAAAFIASRSAASTAADDGACLGADDGEMTQGSYFVMPAPPPRQRIQRRHRSRLSMSSVSVSLLLLPALLCHVVVSILLLVQPNLHVEASASKRTENRVVNIKVGALLEESDHEQANMFIRTIKMINERKDETIEKLLSSRRQQLQPRPESRRRQPRTSSPSDNKNREANSRRDIGVTESTAWITSGGNSAAAAAGIDGMFGGPETRTGLFKRTGVADYWLRYNNNNNTSNSNSSPTDRPHSYAADEHEHHDKSNSNSNNDDDDDAKDAGPMAAAAAQVKLEPMIEFILDRNSAFEADGKVCQLIESGVHALVGPLDGSSIEHVQSICDNMEIPYFELRPYLGSPAGPASSQPVPSLSPPPPPPSSSSAATASTSNPTSPSQALNPLPSSAVAPSQPPPPSSSSLSLSAEASASVVSQRQVATAAINNGRREQQTAAAAAAAAATASSSSNIVEDLTLNLHPPAYLLTSAYIDLIYAWNWTSFAIVYEEGNSMIKLQDLFKESSGSWTSKWQIKLFQFDTLSSAPPPPQASSSPAMMPADDELAAPPMQPQSNYTAARQKHDQRQQQQRAYHHHHFQTRPGVGGAKLKAGGLTFRDIFWRIKLSGEQNILLDVKTDNLYEALKQAQQVGCMTERFSYLITSLDLQTLDLEDFKYSRTRITAFSIINVIRSQQQPSSTYEDTQRSRAGGGSKTSDVNNSNSNDDTDTDQEDKFRQRDAAAAATIIADETDSSNGQRRPPPPVSLIDDKYLERLGVHVSRQTSTAPPADNDGPRADSTGRHAHHSNGAAGTRSMSSPAAARSGKSKYKLSPSVTLERSGSFMDPPQDAYNRDWFRREMLQSSPASMGLLPSVDRDNELRLFEFFVEQQENNLPRIKMSTASAILHDALILLLRGLHEFDPSGQLLAATATASSSQNRQLDDPMQLEQPIVCSLNSKPWLHGSSLVNYMRQASFQGLTGNVAFDQRGLRSQFKLDMLGMAPDIGLIKVGEWHSHYDWQRHQQQLNCNPQQQQQSDEAKDSSPSSSGARETTHRAMRPTYDELSELYDLELKRYEKLLASGVKVQVPYSKPIWRPTLIQRFGLAPTNQEVAMSTVGGTVDSRQRNRLLEQYNGPALMVNDIIFERLYREQADQVDTLIVTTKLSQPYFMLKETPNKLEGNDQYEGFAVDLVHELSKLINFKYRWREVADKKYGSKEVLPNGTVVWNGMIGELLRGQADLAIVDLTITAQREEAVDFTLPFMNTGISILFKKPTTKVTTLFSFLSPFSSDVWAYVLAAYCGISANLFLVGHLSPYEWADPHPCRHSYESRSAARNSQDDGDGDDDDDDDDDYDGSTSSFGRHTTKVLENQFSLLNSFWFTIGSLMQQGSDLTPRSMSTRTIAGIWYFFTLIMISSYTANLAAFLTVEKVVYPIENVRDLSQQTEIRYGCVESGSTCTFFHDSQIDTYKRITETMRRFNTYVRSNDEGQKRVEEGKFAYFMESASIEYIIERNCNLTQIGGLLDSKGYGLATSKRSRLKRPYRTLLSEGILHLQETGMLHVLKNRWWKERRGGGTCTDDGKGGGVTELSLANVGGVFVVLLGGLGISFLVAIAEFMWRARRGGSTRDRICEEMMNDLKFALACKSSTKPISLERQQSRRTKRHELLRQQSSSASASGRLESSSNGGGGGGNISNKLLMMTTTTTTTDDQQQEQLHLDRQQQQRRRRRRQQQHRQQGSTLSMLERYHRRQQSSTSFYEFNDHYNESAVGAAAAAAAAEGNPFITPGPTSSMASSDFHKTLLANDGGCFNGAIESPSPPSLHNHRHHYNNNNNNNDRDHNNHLKGHHQHHRQQQQRQQQAATPSDRGVKECDPILFHAMLAMLKQQQPIFNDGSTQRASQSMLSHQQSTFGHPATSTNQQQQQRQQQQQKQKQNSRLSKRRLLFAQRTIDGAADNVPASSSSTSHAQPTTETNSATGQKQQQRRRLQHWK